MPLFAEGWDWPGFGMALVATGTFGVLGILLLAFGFKVFDWMLPKIDVEKELAEKNVAVGIVTAAVLLAIAVIVHAAIHG